MHRFLLWQIVKFPFMKIDWYDATLRRPSAFYDPLIHYNFKQRALSKYLVSCLFAAEGEEESKLFFKIIFFSNQHIWELFIIQLVMFLGCAVGACWWSLVPDPWWCWLLPPWPAPCSPLPATDCVLLPRQSRRSAAGAVTAAPPRGQHYLQSPALKHQGGTGVSVLSFYISPFLFFLPMFAIVCLRPTCQTCLR